MATRFPSDVDAKCERCKCCKGFTLKYEVREKQWLCQTCATDKGTKLRGYWACDKHEKIVRFFCENHDVEACQACVTVSHRGDCVVLDIDNAIEKRKEEIYQLQRTAKDKKSALFQHIKEIEDFKSVGESHLKFLEREINSFVDGELRKNSEKEKSITKDIDLNADEEIRKINSKREAKKRAIREESEKQRLQIDDKRSELLSDVRKIARAYTLEVEEQLESPATVSQRLDNNLLEVEEILENDRKLLKETNQVVAKLLTEIINEAPIHDDPRKFEERVLNLQRVKFYRPTTPTMLCPDTWRIDGYHGMWSQVKEIPITDDLAMPFIFGCLSENEIAVRCFKETNLRLLNLETRKAPVVIGNTNDSGVVSCVPLTKDTVVCGKTRSGCTTAILADNISIYDTEEWRLIRNVSIPRNTSGNITRVYADVDRGGMIIAVERDQSNIYVIDPANGAIIETITVHGMVVQGRALALSSGDFVAKVVERVKQKPIVGRIANISIINRMGDVVKVIRDDRWDVDPRYVVDSATDALYVLYENLNCDHFHLDEVSLDGNVIGKQIAKIPTSTLKMRAGRITPSGLLVCFNGRRLFVFKKNITW